MKTVYVSNYGSPDVLEFKDIEKPSLADDRVLVKIKAAAVNPLDWHVLRGTPFLVRLMGFGLFKPKHNILGADVSGVVEAVGKDVKGFKPGDEVFGDVVVGGFAEYIAARETSLVNKPMNLTFEEAAAVPIAALTALQALRDHGKIKPGQKVLINGASGGVGTFAVQIAKSFDTEVTGVCSTKNLELVRSLGADHVVDYTKDDITHSDREFDLILDAAAFGSIMAYRRIMASDGIYVLVGGSNSVVFRMPLVQAWSSLTSRKKMTSMLAAMTQADLGYLKDLIEAGKVKPVIDRRYSFGEVPDAIRYVEAGHARGKVVITIDQANSQ